MSMTLSSDLENWLLEFKRDVPDDWRGILIGCGITSPEQMLAADDIQQQFVSGLKVLHGKRFMKAIESLRQRICPKTAAAAGEITQQQLYQQQDEASLIGSHNAFSRHAKAKRSAIKRTPAVKKLTEEEELRAIEEIVNALNDLIYPEDESQELSQKAKYRMEYLKDANMQRARQLTRQLQAAGVTVAPRTSPSAAEKQKHQLQKNCLEPKKHITWDPSVIESKKRSADDDYALKIKRIRGVLLHRYISFTLSRPLPIIFMHR